MYVLNRLGALHPDPVDVVMKPASVGPCRLRLSEVPRFEYLIATGLAVASTVVVLATQDLVAAGNGAGWDGRWYVSMVDPSFVAPAPYCLRIGWPFLARHLGVFADPLSNFMLISVTLGALYALASWVLLAALFPSAGRLARFVAWSALNVSELAPIRLAGWYPANTDIPANFLFLVLTALVLLEFPRWSRLLGLWLVFFVGTTIRENFMVNSALVGLVLAVTFERGHIWLVLTRTTVLPVLSCLAGMLAAAFVIHSVTGQPIVTGKFGVMLRWLQHFKFISVVQALFSVYGFALLLAVGAMGSPRRHLPEAPALAVFVLLTLPIAMMGGGNTERFLYWYMLLVVLLALPWLDALVVGRRWTELAAAFAYLALIQRYYVPIHTTAGVPVNAGCAFGDYLRGGTPHLLHYIYHCGTEHLPPFLALFFGALAVVVLARVRVGAAGRE